MSAPVDTFSILKVVKRRFIQGWNKVIPHLPANESPALTRYLSRTFHELPVGIQEPAEAIPLIILHVEVLK
jgi:hypothetical protein